MSFLEICAWPSDPVPGINEMSQTDNRPVKTFNADSLAVRIHASEANMADDAARAVRDHLAGAIAAQGEAAAILATGNSQLQFLECLIALDGVDWSRVILFHMDEYLGIDANHPASFQRYMRERVESRLNPKVFHYLGGDAPEPIAECERYEALLKAQPIDLCCMGIGENGHLAFNDPPVADFDDPRTVKLVQLDEQCRQQQVNEGHYPNLDAVPAYALTLTIPTLCRARKISCVVPGPQKAQAVKDSLQGPVSTACPGSHLRSQAHATLFLDDQSSSLLG